MISYSDTNSEVSQTERNFQSNKKNDYKNKISAIWDNIQKTKNIERSDGDDNDEENDNETYQAYRNQRVHEKRLSGEKVGHHLQRKIMSSVKARRGQNMLVDERKSYVQEKNERNSPSYSSMQNRTKNLSNKNEKKYIEELQEKLQKSRENTNILIKKLIQAQQQIEYLEYELEKQMTQKDELLAEMKEKSKVNIMNDRQKENRGMTSNNKKKDDQQALIEARITIDKYRLRLKAAEREVQEKDAQCAALEQQIRRLSGEIQQCRMKGVQKAAQKTVFKGSQLLELNQAYKTIERLVALLRSTQQYRLLGNFAEQMKNIHFLSKIPRQIKSELSAIKISSSKSNKEKQSSCSHCTQIKINERLLWTPLLCYKKMLEMKMKHDSLNEECIQEVLFEMNRLYLSKEESRISKLKASYETEIQKLKKKTQLTYDQILAKKQIQRLKKELQTTKKKSTCKPSSKRPTDPYTDERLKKFTTSSNLQSLQAIGQYEDEMRLKDKQVKLLSERIKLLENQTSSFDKSLYMEGILWIIDKILEELDMSGEDVKEFEDKFRAKMDSAISTEDWIRLFKEFFQSIQGMNHALIEKILTIKETTINKINYAKLS